MNASPVRSVAILAAVVALVAWLLNTLLVRAVYVALVLMTLALSSY